MEGASPEETTRLAARKALMKANGQSAGQGNKFMKGEEPFDLAKAQAIFANYQKAAADFGKLFPANSKDGDTAALPVVWENKADFDAKLKVNEQASTNWMRVVYGSVKGE